MRRQARRMRRYGWQPMIVMNSGDPLPEILLVIITRWAWRYRSELAPLTTAVALTLTAWVLHATHPQTWPVVAAVAAVTATGLSRAAALRDGVRGLAVGAAFERDRRNAGVPG